MHLMPPGCAHNLFIWLFFILCLIIYHLFPVRITSGSLPKGLHMLNLSKNHISAIEGLKELTRLRVLDLSYNKISRIGHGMTLFTTFLYH